MRPLGNGVFRWARTRPIGAWYEWRNIMGNYEVFPPTALLNFGAHFRSAFY